MPRLCLRVLQLAVACAPATAFLAAGAWRSEWGPVLATSDCDSILCMSSEIGAAPLIFGVTAGIAPRASVPFGLRPPPPVFRCQSKSIGYALVRASAPHAGAVSPLVRLRMMMLLLTTACRLCVCVCSMCVCVFVYTSMSQYWGTGQIILNPDTAPQADQLPCGKGAKACPGDQDNHGCEPHRRRYGSSTSYRRCGKVSVLGFRVQVRV